MIISASRRTDIPARFASWMLRRIEIGRVEVLNPFNPGQRRRVSLDRNDVDAVVFWTKYPAPEFDAVMDALDARGVPFIVQQTITGHEAPIEANLPPLETRIARFLDISRRLGPERMIWRYDPIITLAGMEEEPLERFARLCAELDGATQRVVVSFLDPNKYKRAMGATSRVLRRLHGDQAEMRDLMAPQHADTLARACQGLASIAASAGMRVLACSHDRDLTPYGIHPSACVDANLLNRIFGLNLALDKDKNQRLDCRCAPSVDIGAYGTCANGCVYCYADARGMLTQNLRRHDVEGACLVGAAEKEEKTTARSGSEWLRLA